MNIRIQSLDDVQQGVETYVAMRKREGSKPLLHGIFSRLRKMEKYTFIGDYPLLQSTLVALNHIGMPVGRRKVISCVNRRCTDLKGTYRGKKHIMETLYAYCQ